MRCHISNATMITNALAQHGIKAKIIYPNPVGNALDIVGHILRVIGIRDMMAGDVEIKVSQGQKEAAEDILNSEGIYHY